MAASDQSAPLFSDLAPQSDGRRQGHILRFHKLVETGWLALLSGAETAVWTALEHFAIDREGGIVREPTADIAEAVGHATTANVRTVIRTFVRGGLAKVEEAGGGGKGIVVRMLVPGPPAESELGRQRLAAPGRAKRAVPVGITLTTVEVQPGATAHSIGEPVQVQPGAGSSSTDTRLRFNREPVEVQPIPGSSSTAHYIRRVNDGDDGDDGVPPAVAGEPPKPARAVGLPDVLPPAPIPTTVEPTPPDVPAAVQVVEAKPVNARRPPSTPQAALIEHFRAGWRDLYDGDYPDQKADFVQAASLLRKCGNDPNKARAVIDRYLHCGRPFFADAKHPFSMLMGTNVLPQFFTGTPNPNQSGGNARGKKNLSQQEAERGEFDSGLPG